MTIWLLALLLLASTAGLGLRQGAIRVSISFIGILVGALLAVPLGKFLRPIVGSVGVKDPVLLWVLPPIIMFIIISILFKTAAAAVHQKVDVYYKYKAGDLRLALWERLNHRVGLCVGLLNGVAYLILISFVLYTFSYWTYQVSSDEDPRLVRILNRLGRDLHSTGLAKAAKAVDRMPKSFYESADVAGLLYHNSLLEARLSRYPGFLGLAERGEFQTLGSDREFLEIRQRRDPIKVLLNHQPVKTIMDNPELLRTIWGTVVPDLADLRTYLETGKSPKYDPETILGRWRFNVNFAMYMMRRARPNISSTEMQKIKKWMVAAFNDTSLVAMPDKEVVVKNLPPLRPDPTGVVGRQTFRGKWENMDPNQYRLSFPDQGNQGVTATIEGDRLSMKFEGTDLVFTRET